MTPAAVPARLRGSAAWAAPLCWVAVMLDGYDAVVLGAVLPTLLENEVWGIDAASGTVVATAGLFGMTIGAMSMGWATDRFGRRKLMIGSVVLFSLFTALSAFSPNLWVFGLLRFLAGVGMGGCLPTGIALVTEFSRPHRRGSAATVMMTGFHVGAVVTSALAIVVLANASWTWMLIIGSAPALVLVPLMYRFLPESPEYLRAQEAGRGAQSIAAAAEPEAAGVRILWAPAYRRTTVAMLCASFMGLLLVYGLNTWLPQIMRAADYAMGNALGFLVLLNVGAVVGLVLAGLAADRLSPRTAAILWFGAAALMLAVLVVKLPLLGTYVLVFATGAFVFSAQVLVYAFTATHYPASVRATALGMSAGVGRLGAICGPVLGGVLLTAGLAYPWGFFGFAVAAVLGLVALLLTRSSPRE